MKKVEISDLAKGFGFATSESRFWMGAEAVLSGRLSDRWVVMALLQRRRSFTMLARERKERNLETRDFFDKWPFGSILPSRLLIVDPS